MQRLVVHPAQHQHLAGVVLLHHGRDQAGSVARESCGDGDVHVAPAIGLSGRAMVSIELSSPDGHLVLLARAADVVDFIARTVAVVSPGTESDVFDADMLISQLLAS